MERENIWAVGAHVGCHNGHFAWDCISKGLGKMKLFGSRCCIGKRALQRWDVCFSAVSLKRRRIRQGRQGPWEGTRRRLLDLSRTNTTQKNVQKDKGRPIMLPTGVKMLGPKKYENWKGLYEPLNQDQLSRQCRRLVVTEYVLKAVWHCGPSVTGSRLQGSNPSRSGKGSCARLLHCRLEHGPVEKLSTVVEIEPESVNAVTEDPEREEVSLAFNRDGHTTRHLERCGIAPRRTVPTRS